jgi:hypothetical protein
VTAGRSSVTRCPALVRASSLLLLLGLFSACASYYPEPVRGVSNASAWVALPLRRWLAEDRAEPEAVAICRPPECGPGMVVAVVRTHGEDADEAEAVLRNPERLARALEDMRDRKSKVRTKAAARRLTDGALQGFALELARDDGERPAFGAALGRRTGDGLEFVLAIGDDRDAVEATLRKVAAQHLISSSSER